MLFLRVYVQTNVPAIIIQLGFACDGIRTNATVVRKEFKTVTGPSSRIGAPTRAFVGPSARLKLQLWRANVLPVTLTMHVMVSKTSFHPVLSENDVYYS